MKTRARIVDDDPNLSRLGGVILETTNLYEVRIEFQALRALAAAREFKLHIVLLDVDMPGRDGGAIANDIRTRSALVRPFISRASLPFGRVLWGQAPAALPG